jgi:hypothetical protein
MSSRSLHVAALASLAIVQPLFDLLGRSPEFLLAHDLGPSEILSVVFVVGLVVPLAFAIVIAMLERLHPASGRGAATTMLAVFATLMALYAAKSLPLAFSMVAALAATAGTIVAVLYHRTAVARAFTTWLVPAVVVVPLVFVLRPGVGTLIWPQEHEVAQTSASTTPVVLIVFDGLPLTALLDANRAIDRELYPSFAAFADQSTWYTNATTVSDYTQWSVPAIVSGRYPERRSLPIASHHPETLLTLLGSSHTVEVHEPISRLCPQSLCDHGGEGTAHELLDFADTLSLAYLHTILPEIIQAKLPAIDQGWAEGVPPSEEPGEMWLRGGDRSRRGEALAFINAMKADAEKPSLHVLHILLPHTPFAYLPQGQRYGTERSLPGLLEGRDRWLDDEWAVTQGYRRFLLQVGYVDTLLGQTVARLKEIDLYDRALIVVTSDHGASFKPGHAFRRLTDDTVMDIAPVPLLIKAPRQRDGVITDLNVETVDILPTIADMLDIEVPWKVDGRSAVGDAAPRVDKTVYHDDARRIKKLPATFREAVYESVDRKLQLFGRGNPYRIPLTSPHHALIGREVDDLLVSEAADAMDFALDAHGDFSNIDPAARFLPAHLSGRARWLTSDGPATVAVAVNGIVSATTRTYRFDDRGSRHAWSVVIPPSAFQSGENEVEVFLVRPSRPPVLSRTDFSHTRPVDLLSNTAAYGMRVSHEGLHEREGHGEGARRWTNGAASISVPRAGRAPARALRVNLATAGPTEKDLRITANGCDVYNGKVPAARWSRIFALSDCGGNDDATVIELRSTTHEEAGSRRILGVAVERIDLLEQSWPPPATPLPEADRRSQIRFKRVFAEGERVASDSHLTVTIVNRGSAIWAGPHDLGKEDGSVRVGVLWRRRGSAAQPVATQRVELPRALVPGDSVEFTFQLVPKKADGTPLPAGEYEAWIGLMQEGVNWFSASGDSVRKLRVVHNARP